MRINRILCIALWGLLTWSAGLLLDTPARAELYSVTTPGTFGLPNSVAYGINHAGQVVGYAATPDNRMTHGFIYSDGTMTSLGALGGGRETSIARGINKAGQVVGQAYTANFVLLHAFLYSDGTMTDLGTLGGSYSNAYGINNAGQVVGVASTTQDATSQAFLYSNGTMTGLGTLGGSNSIAYGITITPDRWSDMPQRLIIR